MFNKNQSLISTTKNEVVDKKNAKDQVIEIMNGCMCCTVRKDLAETLKKMKNYVD